VEFGAFPRAFRDKNITIGAKSAHMYIEQIFLCIQNTHKNNQNLFSFAAHFLFFFFSSYSSFSQGVMEIYQKDALFQ